MKKKLISALLSVMMVAGSMVVPANAQIESNPGVILNGGFEETEPGSENYKYGWDYTAFNIVSSDQAHTGIHMAQTQGSYAPIFQTVDVMENTNYTFSFWYKKSNDSADGVGVMIYDEIFESMDNRGEAGIILGNSGNDFIPLPTTTEWQMYAYSFNSGSNSKLTFVVRRQGTGSNGSGNSVYFDDFVLTPCKEAFANPDFNLGIEGWAQENDVTYVADGGHDGYAAALNDSVNPTYQSLSQTVLVEKNKDYTVSYWYKNENYGHNFIVYDASYTKENANESKVKEIQNHTATDGWVKQTVDFNSGDNEKLTFTIDNCNTKSITYFDDFDFVKAPVELKDGSFESEQDTVWIRNGSHAIAIQKYAYRTGEKSLNINKNASYHNYIEQVVRVDKNTPYRLTYWYKGSDNSKNVAKHKIRIYGENAPAYTKDSSNASNEWNYTDNATKAIVDKTIGDANEWTRQSIEFNSGDNSTISVRFLSGYYSAQSSGDSTNIDDIELMAISDVKNDIIDGGFDSLTYDFWKQNKSNAMYAHIGTTWGAGMIRNGTGSLIIHKTAVYHHYIEQTVNVDKNTAFKLSYWYKGADNNSNVESHKVRVYGENPITYVASSDTNDWSVAKNAIIDKTVGDANEWTKAEYFFNSGSNEQITVRFLPGSYSGTTAHSIIDDVTLEVVEPAYPYIDVKTTELRNSAGDEIDGVEYATDGTIKITGNVRSRFASDAPAKILVAVYNDGQLYSAKIADKTVSNTSDTPIDVIVENLPVEELNDKWSVSVFIWNTDLISPMAAKVEL